MCTSDDALYCATAQRMQIVPEVESFTGGSGVRFVDGNEMAFDAVIFATGYRSNVPSWLKVLTASSLTNANTNARPSAAACC